MDEDWSLLKKTISEAQLDYVLFYSYFDEEIAEEIHKRLSNNGISGRLYDDPQPFDDINDTDKLAIQHKIIARATLKLFLVSDNLVYDADDPEFVACKNEAVANSLRTRDQTIWPLWQVPKRKLPRSTTGIMYGMMALIGFDPNQPTFPDNLKKLLNKEMYTKMREERIQCELESALRQPTRLIVRRHQTPRGDTIIQNITINSQNPRITLEQSKPKPSSSMQKSEQTICYDVPDSFWRTFNSHDGSAHQKYAWTTDSTGSSNQVITTDESYDSDRSALAYSARLTSPHV